MSNRNRSVASTHRLVIGRAQKENGRQAAADYIGREAGGGPGSRPGKKFISCDGIDLTLGARPVDHPTSMSAARSAIGPTCTHWHKPPSSRALLDGLAAVGVSSSSVPTSNGNSRALSAMKH